MIDGRVCASTLLAASVLAACGVPQDKHQSVLGELQQLKADMAAEQAACDQIRQDLGAKKDALEEENTALKTKLAALGEDVTQLQTKAGKMVEDLSEKEKMIARLLEQQAAARRRAAEYRRLVERLREMITAKKLKVSVRNGRMIVQMSDKILFNPAQDRIKPEGKAALKELTEILAGIPDRRFQVAGHTDNVPIRTRRFRSNWELSTARAVNVVKFMSENGMDPERLSAAGYGPHDPVADNETEAGKQLNRRIEITLMPRIEDLPSIPAE